MSGKLLMCARGATSDVDHHVYIGEVPVVLTVMYMSGKFLHHPGSWTAITGD